MVVYRHFEAPAKMKRKSGTACVKNNKENKFKGSKDKAQYYFGIKP